jgi:hypothetical protein
LDIDSGSLKNKIKNKVTLTPKQFNSLDHNNRYQRISLLFFVAKFHHMVTRKKESTTCTKDFGGGGGVKEKMALNCHILAIWNFFPFKIW